MFLISRILRGHYKLLTCWYISLLSHSARLSATAVVKREPLPRTRIKISRTHLKASEIMNFLMKLLFNVQIKVFRPFNKTYQSQQRPLLVFSTLFYGKLGFINYRPLM